MACNENINLTLMFQKYLLPVTQYLWYILIEWTTFIKHLCCYHIFCL